MKKLLAFFSLAFALTLPLGATVFAEDPFNKVCDQRGAGSSEVCSNENRQGGSDPIAGGEGVLIDAVNIVSVIAGAAAIIVIIVAGLQFIFAGGDSNKITNARNAIIFALVGIIFIAVSRSVIVFVINRL